MRFKDYIITYDLSGRLTESKHKEFKDELYNMFTPQDTVDLEYLPNTTVLISTTYSISTIEKLIKEELSENYNIKTILIVEHTNFIPVHLYKEWLF